jgi:molecular chaperone DnaJ
VAARRKFGDMLVTVEVAVPQKLSAEERRAVEALAAAANGASPRAHLGVEEATS